MVPGKNAARLLVVYRENRPGTARSSASELIH
jgi:hypothetical protein